MKKGKGLAKCLLTGILSAMLILAALPVSAFAYTMDTDSKTITVTSDDGADGIQDAINYISSLTDENDYGNWTIVVGSGTYNRFIVSLSYVSQLTGLTIKADNDAEVIISVLDGSSVPTGPDGAALIDYVNTWNGGGILINVPNVTLSGLTFKEGEDSSTSYWWGGLFIDTLDGHGVFADGLTIEECDFIGSTNSRTGMLLNGYMYSWSVTGCTFTGLHTVFDLEFDNAAVKTVTITGNTITNCDVLFDNSYFGGTPSDESGTFTFSNNTVTGTSDNVVMSGLMNEWASKNSIGTVTFENNTFKYTHLMFDYIGLTYEYVLNNNVLGTGSYVMISNAGHEVASGTDGSGYSITLAAETEGTWELLVTDGISEDDIALIKAAIESATTVTVGDYTYYVLTINLSDFDFEGSDVKSVLYAAKTLYKKVYWNPIEGDEKDSEPGIKKKILVTTETTDDEGNTTTETTEVDSYSVNAGDTVTFRLTSNVPDYLLEYLGYEYAEGDDKSDYNSDEEDTEDESTGNSGTDTDTDDNNGSTDTDTDTESGTTEDDSSDTDTSGSESESSKGTVAAASAEDNLVVADAVVKKSSSYVITFHDVLSSYFTLSENSFTVTIGGVKLLSDYYTLVFSGDTDDDGNVIITDGCTFELSIDLADLYRDGIIDEDDIAAAAEIVVTYTATLSSDATAGDYTNQAWVEYEGTTTDEPEVNVYVYGIKIYKIDEDGTTSEKDEDGNVTYTYTYLEGATFTLYSDSSLGEDYIVATLTTDEDGYLCFDGLAAGTYYLVETNAPDGYVGSTAAVTIILPEDDNSVTSYYYESIINNAAIPNTGGMGTTILYIIGAALVLCAGIVLVTRRRMSGGDE